MGRSRPASFLQGRQDRATHWRPCFERESTPPRPFVTFRVTHPITHVILSNMSIGLRCAGEATKNLVWGGVRSVLRHACWHAPPNFTEFGCTVLDHRLGCPDQPSAGAASSIAFKFRRSPFMFRFTAGPSNGPASLKNPDPPPWIRMRASVPPSRSSNS